MIVLVVLLSMSASIAGYINYEIHAAKRGMSAIEARYAAEAGIEHFIYHLKSKVNEKNTSGTLTSSTITTSPSLTELEGILTSAEMDLLTDSEGTTWDDDNGLVVDNEYTYLTNGDFTPNWTDATTENRITINSSDYYYVLNAGTEIVKSYDANVNSPPKMVLPGMAASFFYPKDAFKVKFSITGQNADTSIARTIKTTIGFNVKLWQADDPEPDPELYDYNPPFYIRLKQVRTWKTYTGS